MASLFLDISTGPVAQWITRLTTDQEIPGSNPGRFETFFPFHFGNLVHHGAGTDEVNTNICFVLATKNLVKFLSQIPKASQFIGSVSTNPSNHQDSLQAVVLIQRSLGVMYVL